MLLYWRFNLSSRAAPQEKYRQDGFTEVYKMACSA
jgi:hypothetical protein